MSKRTEQALKKAYSAIQAKKYDEARKILKKMPDDPNALRMLAQLNEEHPPTSNVTTGLGCLTLFILAAFVYFAGRDGASSANTPPTDDFIVRTEEGRSTPVVSENIPTREVQTSTSVPPTVPRPTATITSTPDDETRVRRIVDGVVIGNVGYVNVLTVSPDYIISFSFEMPQDFSGYNIPFTERNMVDIACTLRDSGFAEYFLQMSAMIALVDAFGNESTDDGLTVRLEPETAARINCENAPSVNLQAIADEYLLHRLLRDQ